MKGIHKFYFKNVDFHDPFFDSFKKEHEGFTKWFFSKAIANEEAFVLFDDFKVRAFSYPTVETSPDENIVPKLRKKKRVTVKAFKTLDESTYGKTLLDSIFSYAGEQSAKEICVTAFDSHKPTINLLKTNGFDFHGILKTDASQELVFVKKGKF